MAEHAAVNRRVVGSSPTGGEKEKHFKRSAFSFSLSPVVLSLIFPCGYGHITLKSERLNLSAAVNWNRSECRRWRSKRGEIRAAVEKVEVTFTSPMRFSGTANRMGRWFEPNRGRKKKLLFERTRVFQLYSPAASYIELRSVIFASQVIFASRVLEANIISLKPQGFNITFTK